VTSTSDAARVPPSLAHLRELARRIENLRADSERVIADAEAAIRQSRLLIAAARSDGAHNQLIVQFPGDVEAAPLSRPE
jgi:hypothetical protein